MLTVDRTIRQELHNDLLMKYGQDTDTLVIHEFKVCQGEARIDIALVNGEMHGYEIKSDRDTLERLPAQVMAYSKVFDTVTIVLGHSHLSAIESLVPEWCGLSVAICEDSSVSISYVRRPETNPFVDAFSLAQFLWCNELRDLITRHGAEKKITRLPRFKLWAYVAENVATEELRAYVRDCLKKRQDWRPDALRMLGDG